MRITDLLDKRSISLDAAPKTKSEALDMAVDLMVKSEKDQRQGSLSETGVFKRGRKYDRNR